MLRTFNNILDLQSHLGCAGQAYVYRKGNKKYTHHTFVTEVLEIIASGMVDHIKGLLLAAPVVGLMIDESADVSGKDWRLLDKARRPYNIFGGFTQIDTADAESITAVIVDILSTYGVSHDKLVAFASDGASVMTGVRAGRQTTQRESQSSVFTVFAID